MRKEHAPRPSFADQTARLLVRRVQVGAALCVAGTVVFEVADLLYGRSSLALNLLKLTQLLFVAATVWRFRHPLSARQAIGLTLTTVCVIAVVAVLGGVVGYDADTTCVLLTVIAMTAATVLPWGVGAQTVLVLVSVTAFGFAIPWMDVPHGLFYPGLAVLTGFTVSLYFASVFQGFRIDRWEADEALHRSDERLAGEAAASAALARVGREMIATLDQPMLLDRLCALTRETLEAQCSHTILRHQDDDAWIVVSTCGHADDECDPMHGLAVDGPALRALLPSRDGEGVGLASVPAEFRGRCASAVMLYMPLRRGDDVVGVHAAGFGSRLALTRDEGRLAGGIARVASMALANAKVVEELERKSRLKSEFVSTVSHEIRTPLNVMLGFLEMVEDPDFETGERRELTGRIKTVAHELLDLVESTLEVGRMEAGRDGRAFERLELPAFWRALAESCGRFPRRAGVALEWEPPPDVALLTEPKKLGIVVRNLVGNALKFTERGFVRVSADACDGRLILRVADTGVGIAAEDQAAVFEMFRQASGPEPGRCGGSGFGLYIVRTFVAQLGGAIALDSALGVGSSFTVSLPLVTDPPADARLLSRA